MHRPKVMKKMSVVRQQYALSIHRWVLMTSSLLYPLVFLFCFVFLFYLTTHSILPVHPPARHLSIICYFSLSQVIHNKLTNQKKNQSINQLLMKWTLCMCLWVLDAFCRWLVKKSSILLVHRFLKMFPLLHGILEHITALYMIGKLVCFFLLNWNNEAYRWNNWSISTADTTKPFELLSLAQIDHSIIQFEKIKFLILRKYYCYYSNVRVQNVFYSYIKILTECQNKWKMFNVQDCQARLSTI